MSSILILLLIGLLSGLLSGIAGLGGGIIIVPLLVWLLGFNQKLAQGTSVGVLILPVGILAVYNYYKAGQIDFRSSLFIASTFIIGSFIGSKIAIALPIDLLKKIFAGFVILMGIKLLFFDK